MKQANTSPRWSKPVSLQMLFKKSISFHAERYEEWQQGRCINQGSINIDLHGITDGESLSFDIPEHSKFRIHSHIDFPFFGSNVLNDRIQYVNPPQSQDSTCPIILHIFIKNQAIEYIRFAMSFPDRIIEFYGYQIESLTSKHSDF